MMSAGFDDMAMEMTTLWRIPPEKSIEYGKLAVDSGVYPLYEVSDGVWKITRKVKTLKPVADYILPLLN